MEIKNRSRICLIVSAAIFVLALILTVFGHGINLGIDFEGGLSMQYDLKASVERGDVEAVLDGMNAGTYTVFYKITAANYNEKTGSATVDISKADPAAADGP